MRSLRSIWCTHRVSRARCVPAPSSSRFSFRDWLVDRSALGLLLLGWLVPSALVSPFRSLALRFLSAVRTAFRTFLPCSFLDPSAAYSGSLRHSFGGSFRVCFLFLRRSVGRSFRVPLALVMVPSGCILRFARRSHRSVTVQPTFRQRLFFAASSSFAVPSAGC